jgi:hypothetical protein
MTDAPPIIIDEDAAIDSAFFDSHAGRTCYARAHRSGWVLVVRQAVAQREAPVILRVWGPVAVRRQRGLAQRSQSARQLASSSGTRSAGCATFRIALHAPLLGVSYSPLLAAWSQKRCPGPARRCVVRKAWDAVIAALIEVGKLPDPAAQKKKAAAKPKPVPVERPAATGTTVATRSGARRSGRQKRSSSLSGRCEESRFLAGFFRGNITRDDESHTITKTA